MPEPPPRDDNGTTTCPICHARFVPIRRQRYCSTACRKTAWRRRHPDPITLPGIPPARHRRDITVYVCADCDTRYLGQQWCPDCQRPCTRVSVGGLCPHCEEPVVLTDLLDTTEVNPQPPGRQLS